MAMNAAEPRQGARALAEIESDLLKAEAAFADADTRLSEAERDRRAAIDTINRHQIEFDTAVSALRQRSTAGSRWRLELGSPGAALDPSAEPGGEDALILQEEAAAEEAAIGIVAADSAGPAHRAKPKSVSEEFDRLKNLVQTAGNDPGEAGVSKESAH